MTTTARPRPVPQHLCLARRNFLVLGGSAVAVVGAIGPRNALGQVPELVMSHYPRRVIGKLSELVEKEPVEFSYPNEDVLNMLVKLGEPAGGGVGEARDVVAFNPVCTHMGAAMGPSDFRKPHNVLGPCPLHLSTFDLTKYGMICSGHATASLPQIVLETEGDDIIAVGVMGLLYGYSQNPTG